jgi:WD40 repeat protein
MKDDRIKDALERIARRDVPDDVNLWPRIAVRLDRKNSLIQSYRTRPLTRALILILFLLMLTGVAYAMGNLFGFIPGVGIIEQGVPLRILSDSVTEMREGITTTIQRAVLSGDKTTVIYSVEGIPAYAYPESNKAPGCTKAPEIHLQDGSTLKFSSGESASWGTGYETRLIYFAIPVSIDSATLIIPCIYGTLPGTLPENWELKLQFVPAPPSLTVMPVTEVSPSPIESGITASQPLVLERVIETQNGYILIGKIRSADLLANMTILDSISQFRIMDAAGRVIITKIPDDVDIVSNKADGIAWAYEIEGKQQAWPLTISIDAINVSVSHGDQFRIKFDTGPNPRTGQEWNLNKDVVINGYRVTLSSVHRLADGYKFTLKTDPQVTGVNVWIVGFDAAGGGGGSDGKGNFNLSNVYEGDVPSGELTLAISIQSVFMTVPWSITWQPEVLPAATPNDTSSSPPATCLAGDMLSKLTPPPANLNGKVLLYESLDAVSWGVNLASLDGSQRHLVAYQGNWATLSPDGTRVVYSGADGQIHVRDLETGDEKKLEGTAGYDLHLSPDGKFIAAVDMGNLRVIDLDSSDSRYIPVNSITFGVAGWSFDGAKVYITTPESQGFILQTVDIITGEVSDLYILEDSSRKEPYATVSPDENWVAYRGQENNRLYLVRTNGADGHLLVARIPAVISSIVWSADSKWLGISLSEFGSDERTVLILQPEGCEMFILPNLHGEIQGFILP